LEDKTEDLCQQVSAIAIRAIREEVANHGVLGAQVVNDESSNESSRHIEQAEFEDIRQYFIATKRLKTYLITTFHPKTTVKEEFPPVILKEKYLATGFAKRDATVLTCL
jgi:hypothetical protein